MSLIPYPNQPKLENLQYGKIITKAFLKINGYNWIEPDLIKNYQNITWNKSSNVFRGQFLGRSKSNIKIQIDLSKCKNPVGVPGFSWSFTGYKADITPAGVLAHEVGHYVDFMSDWQFSQFFRKCPGKAVSSYEPNELEKFAESMRLFILNPELLKAANNNRYQTLIEFGLKPIINKPWELVLKNANQQIISATKSWINRE